MEIHALSRYACKFQFEMSYTLSIASKKTKSFVKSQRVDCLLTESLKPRDMKLRFLHQLLKTWSNFHILSYLRRSLWKVQVPKWFLWGGLDDFRPLLERKNNIWYFKICVKFLLHTASCFILSQVCFIESFKLKPIWGIFAKKITFPSTRYQHNFKLKAISFIRLQMCIWMKWRINDVPLLLLYF